MMANYSEKLKSPKWQKKRLEIMKRDKFKCRLCHDEETTLHVHHLHYKGDPWNSSNEDLITLCEHCHHEIESMKNEDFAFGEMSILKVYGLNDKSRIMFIQNTDQISMKIYSENGLYLRGYLLTPDILDAIQKLYKKSKIY